MSDPNSFGQAYNQASEAFSKFVPGFDFLQGLVKNAGKALPSMGQWVAPTLDPAELERRIEELKTVQFWLEQNARMLGATIQALEVQRMTLGALKGMNVSMGDLSEALKVRVPDLFTASAPAAAPATATPPAPAPEPAMPSDDPPAAPAAGAVDPMQWWGALTQQFTTLATQAMQATQDAAAQAAQAGEAVQAATQAATSAAAAAAAEAAKPMADAMQQAAQAAAAPARKATARKASPATATPPKAAAPKAAATKAAADAVPPARKPSAPRRAAAADTPARAPRRKPST